MTETRQIRLKRLGLRSWRRGMKETDLILGGFADARLASMDEGALDGWERLLDENDQDIFAWVTGAADPPPDLAEVIGQLRGFAGRDRAT